MLLKNKVNINIIDRVSGVTLTIKELKIYYRGF